MIDRRPREVVAKATRALALALALATEATTARADDGVAGAEDDARPRDPWRPGLLAPGALQLGIGGWLRRYDRAVGLGPELWLGIGPRLTLGLGHGPGSDGLAAPGRGLCVRACGPRYRGAVTALVDLGARDGLLGRAQLVVEDVAAATIAIELGAIGRWRQGRAWGRLEPALRLGLVGRDHDNRERAGVELAAGAIVARAVSLGLVVHPRGPADEQFFSGLVTPAWLELSARLPAGLALGLALGTDDVFATGGGHAQAALALAWRR